MNQEGSFSVYFYKYIYTKENLRKMGINDQQINAVKYVKQIGRITNKKYQEICEVKKRKAPDDLRQFEDKEILEWVGKTGKDTYYIIKGHQWGKKITKCKLRLTIPHHSNEPKKCSISQK